MKEFFARLNPTERRFVVGVGVLFFIIVNMVYIWPHFGDWGQTKTRMATASDKLVQFERGTNLIPGLQMQIQKYQNQGQVVPPADQALRFVRLVQNQAAQSGVIIVSMGNQRQTGNTNAFFMEQNETLTLQSGEKELVNFLYTLGAGDSLIRAKSMSVHPDQSHTQLSTSVTLIASYEKKSAGAPPATTAPARPAPHATPAPPHATAPAPHTAAPPVKAPVPANKLPTNAAAGGLKHLTPKK